jgi:hypothetical protein
VGLDDTFNSGKQASLDRSRSGPEPRPGKGPVQRCRCLARAFAFLCRPEAALESARAVPHHLRGPFKEQKRGWFFRLARKITRYVRQHILAVDRARISERPALCDLMPFGTVRCDEPGMPPCRLSAT